MRLTQWTDYSLRVLMYCAACQDRARPPTVAEIAEAHGISRSHLMKIVMSLASLGWLETTRGRGGGLRLLKPADELRLGDVIRQTESDMVMVECFDPVANQCKLDGHCRLKGVFREAMHSYLDTLDGYTLADLMAPPTLARSTALQPVSVALPKPVKTGRPKA